MLLLPLAFALLLAGQAAPEGGKPSRPSDVQAYSGARGLKDPDQKIAAFEKFRQDYPDSRMVPFAEREIVTTTVTAHPKDRKRILKTVDRLGAGAKGNGKAMLYNAFAWQLYEANLFLKDAEKYAKKSTASWSYSAFAAAAREDAKKSRGPEPDEAGLRKAFARERAASVDTLGQIYAKRGKAAQAERFLKEALAADPSLDVSALALAQLSEKAGRTEQALSYYTQAVLLRPGKANRKSMVEFWARTHAGSASGLDDYLDSMYRKLLPNPVNLEPYKPSPGRTNRLVLAEVYTGAGCGPCAAADLAFDAAMERYSRRELAVIMYHQHIPRPDPLTNDATLDRWQWQQGRGVPAYLIDGKLDGGGGPRENTGKVIEKLEALIRPALEKPAGARLSLSGWQEGRTVRATADVSGIEPRPTAVTLHIALVEKLVRYAGENGIRFHPMVVRAFTSYRLPGAQAKFAATVFDVFDVDEVEKKIRAYLDRFEVKDERHNPKGTFRFTERKDKVDEKSLAVVAFVQDDKSKEVLQAAWLDLAGAAKVSRK